MDLFKKTQSFFSAYGFALGIALVVLLSALYTHARILDSDEGFYVRAATAFPDELPYRDYFFSQSPLTVPIYWAFSHGPLDPWTANRFGAWMLSLGALGLAYATIKNRFSEKVAQTAALLLGFNFFFIQWAGVAKTYAPVLLVLAAFMYALERYDATKKNRYLFAMGLLTVFGAGVRLLLGVLAVVVLWAAYKKPNPKTVGAAAGGALVGFLPWAAFVGVASFERFFFNALSWHGLPPQHSLAYKIDGVLNLFFGNAGGLPVVYFANIVLIGLLAWSLREGLQNDFEKMLALGAGALGVVVLLTPNVSDQHFVILLPFLVLFAVRAWPADRRVQAGVWALILIPTLLLVAKPLVADSNGLTPSDVREIARWTSANTPENARVFSYDPLFPVLADRMGVAGLEMGRSDYVHSNGLDGAPLFDSDRAAHYRLMNPERVAQALAAPDVVTLVWNADALSDLARMNASPESFGFEKTGRIKGFVLMQKTVEGS